MQKTAQKRSVLNKLREMTNVSGIAAEKFFNPEFQKVMESLREKDDHIRSIVSGEVIGAGDPGNDPVSVKDLLKSSKSNLNRREYMTAVAELGRVHKKLFDTVQMISSLNSDVDKVHHEFLFKDLDDERKKQLADMKTRFASNQQFSYLVKEAGVMDFFYNIGTKRGRALAAWEKRYPKQVGKLKKDTEALQSKTEALFATVLSSLKEMASARATRNIDNYVKAAEKITKGYQGYDKMFREYYNSNVKGFLEKVELVSPTEKVEDAKELGKQELPVEKKDETISTQAPVTLKNEPSSSAQETLPYAPTTPAPPLPSNKDVVPIPPAPLVPTNIVNTLPYPGTVPDSSPKTEPSPPPSMAPEGENFKSDQLAEKMWGVKAHEKFFSSLQSLSNEAPLILASYIAKYASSIQSTDTDTSIKLFNIVKSIKG
jgi:hypothetical protein